MHRRPTALVVSILAVVALTLSACGGDSSSRPSKSELSDKLQEQGLSAEAADCAAGVLADSDLSDDALQQTLDADTNEDFDESDLNADDRTKYEAVSGEFLECVFSDADLGGTGTGTDTGDAGTEDEG